MIPKPKRRKKPIPREGSYGILDDLDLVPDMQVYAQDQPDEFQRVPLQNTVLIPAAVLEDVRKQTSKKSKKIADTMLSSVADAVALDRAFDFTQQAAEQGLRLELNVSRGVGAIFEDLSTLQMVVEQMRAINMPASVKKYYLKCIIEQLAVHSVEKMRAVNKLAETNPEGRMQAFVIRATPKSDDKDVGRKRSRK